MVKNMEKIFKLMLAEYNSEFISLIISKKNALFLRVFIQLLVALILEKKIRTLFFDIS